jgi:hypothetical protein
MRVRTLIMHGTAFAAPACQDTRNVITPGGCGVLAGYLFQEETFVAFRLADGERALLLPVLGFGTPRPLLAAADNPALAVARCSPVHKKSEGEAGVGEEAKQREEQWGTDEVGYPLFVLVRPVLGCSATASAGAGAPASVSVLVLIPGSCYSLLHAAEHQKMSLGGGRRREQMRCAACCA